MASDGQWYPPELAPHPTPDPDPEPATREWMVREDGRNGTLVLDDRALVRIFRRRLGKDDVLTIPLRSIGSVHHDRRSLGTDVVTVTAGHTSHSWKVKGADAFVAQLNESILG